MFWVIGLMLVILFIGAPSMFRDKMYRELVSFGVLWVLAFVYASLTALKAPLPTVVETLKFIYGLVNYFPQ